MPPENRISFVSPEREKPLLFQVFTDDQRWVNGIKPRLEQIGKVEVFRSEEFFVDRQTTSPVPDIIFLHPLQRFERDKGALARLWYVKNFQSGKKPFICYFTAAPMEREAAAIITNGGDYYVSLTYDPPRIERQIKQLILMASDQSRT